MRNKPQMYYALVILLSVLLSFICCAAFAEDTNFFSTDGLVAFQDGYVYFAGIDDTSGNLNDGRETGLAKSVEIWRIKDEAGTQKELVKTFPVPVPGGVILYGGRDVIPCGENVFFEREHCKDGNVYHTLTRVNIPTGEDEDIFEFRSYSGKFVDGDLLYYYAIVKNNSVIEDAGTTDSSALQESKGKYTNGWFAVNLRTGAVIPWENSSSGNASFGTPAGNRYQYMGAGTVLEIKDGYRYYASRNQNGSDLCIKRKPVEDGNSETIVPYLSDYGEIRSCFVQGNILYLLTEDTLNCIDINTRMLLEAIPTVWGELPVKHEDARYAEWYLKRFNVSNGKIYYLKEDGLYVRVPGEGSETRLIPGDTREFTGLALSDHYVYLFYNDTMSFARIPLTASYLLDLEMLLWADTDHRDIAVEENGWVFFEYENCVVVSDYSGEDLTATVPVQIHGKPVTYVGLSWENENRPLKSLTIPEGVLVMGYLYSKNLQEISLPQSLISIAGNGYPYAFMVAEGTVIRYPGTETEWESLNQEQVDPSYWGTSSYAKDITVNCNEEHIAEPKSELIELSTFDIPDEVLNSVQMTALLYDDASEAISVTPLDLTGTDLEDFQDAYEYQLIQRANELYKSTVKEFGTVDLFIKSEERSRNFYISEKESLHNQYDANLINANTPFDLPALMVNGTIAYLKDGGMGVLEEMGSSFANKVVDMAEDQFGQSLTDLQNAMGIKALSKKDFVYSETQYGEQIFKTDDLKSLMMKAKENDGKFTSAEDAVSFIIAFQRNQIAKRSMQLAHDYKIKLMNRDSIEIVIDTLESVALSAVSGIINNVFLGGNSVVGLFVGRTVDTVFKSMDFIATEYKDPFIQDWKHDVRRYQAETVWLFRYDYEEAEKFIQSKRATDGWVNHWVMQDHPENTMDIIRNQDGNFHVIVYFDRSKYSEFDFKLDNNNTSAFFGNPSEGFNASLWLNAPEKGHLRAVFGYLGGIKQNDLAYPYISSADNILWQDYIKAEDANESNDTGYYWDGWEEPVYLGSEGVDELFGYLSDKVLLAASGAGAWEGRIKFDKDGGFTAYYYDEDAGDDVIYEVYFTGRFDTSSIQLDGTNGYLLRASEISTQHTPGTEAVTDFGSRIVYEEPLFKVGETLLLTRPGTPDPEIPEMVQSEIGGVFGQWEDFETFITLSRLADGWGFFADETSPFTWDVEPFKTIREVDPSLPVFGIDQDYTGWDAKEIFNYLSKQKMFSIDSNGGPASEMRINPDGSFTGAYQGYDNTGFCISNFTGSFSLDIEWYGKTTGYLMINTFSVKNDPNTTGTTTWGEKFVYSDRPFRTGERLFFTLPGTKFTDDIPDDIKSKIYWCYDPYDNYLKCITLNKLDWDMSWWLYADTDYPDTSDIEPIPVAKPEIGSTLPSFGDTPSFAPEPDQNKTFWKEGKGIDYKWGAGLFKERSQIYNNELALAAGVLSWGIEDERTTEISNLFKELEITDGKYCCYKYDRNKNSALRYKLWESKDDDAAFAIGRKIISVNGKNDTTLLIVIGRGTQKGHKREELGADWLRMGDGPEEVAGQKVLRSISSFEEAMWQALGDYVETNPIETSKIKILVTGHSLGGAMANCFGARITNEIKQISWLKNKATEDDIYVYTFGAIKVLTEDKNASEGFENIHNIYNYHDTFGPNGGMHGLNVSSPKMKFGHTELYYLKDETEGFLETKNHNMPNYLTAVKDKMVSCDSSGSFKSRVFSMLSKQKLLASDSRGEWIGEMIIDADGSFTGFYYDYDITGITASSFSGSFSKDVKWQGNTSCYLTIKNFTVKNEPYTIGTTHQGIEFMYTDGPFHTGEQLFLTLPGTADQDIPFTVACEIGWLYGRYKNYGNYLTLSTVEEPAGWGFFADETNPETRDIPSITIPGFEEPIPEIGSLLPTFGDNTRTSGEYQYELLSNGTARITLYRGNQTEVHIPASLDGYSISQIGTRAFFNNEDLESVWMDQAPLTVIQYEAFRGCENLRFVQLPKTLKEVQYMAFDYCIGLTEIVFSEQVQIIGRRAFSYCKKLGEVYCPDSLLYIDGSAFDQCDKETIWFHVGPDSHAEHYCALYGYNYRYGISGNYNPNLETVKRTIDEIRAKGNYADVWVNRWISRTKPELVLNITHNGDDTLHAALSAGQETLLSFDFIPNDNIPESIDMCSGGEEMSFLDFITMNIDAEEGYALRLEGDIQEFDKPTLTGGLQWEDLLFTASEYMPDPLMYGFEPLWRGPIWDGHWRAQKDGHQADLFIANADNESGYVIRLIMDERNVFDCSEIGFYDPYTMMIDFDKFAGMFVLNDDSISFELDPLRNNLSFMYFDFTMSAMFYYAGGY